MPSPGDTEVRYTTTLGTLLRTYTTAGYFETFVWSGDSDTLLDRGYGLLYVSGAGNDGNDGLTPLTPLRTVAEAYSRLPATFGGEIKMLPGLHLGNPITITNTVANRNKPVTLTGAGIGRTVWRRESNAPLLVANGVEDTFGGPEMVSEIMVERMTLDGGGGNATTNGANLVELREANHIIFKDTRFYRVPGSGIYARCLSNGKFQSCRFSELGTTDPSNVAGTVMENGANLDTNGVRWESCDFEVTLSGRDMHLVGDETRRLTNLVISNCKFESAPLSVGYAPSQRVLLERCEDAVIVDCKFIRGVGTQLDMSLCLNMRVFHSLFTDGQGDYMVDFRDGLEHQIDNCKFVGSAALSAHMHIGATAEVTTGALIHRQVGDEVDVFDERP